MILIGIGNCCFECRPPVSQCQCVTRAYIGLFSYVCKQEKELIINLGVKKGGGMVYIPLELRRLHSHYRP